MFGGPRGEGRKVISGLQTEHARGVRCLRKPEKTACHTIIETDQENPDSESLITILDLETSCLGA